jgi:hypothetical protein
MDSLPPKHAGMVWCERLFALALLPLILQLVPSWGTRTLWAIDIRNWSRPALFIANGVVLLFLVGARFAPDLYLDWRARQKKRAANLCRVEQQQKIKEQREAIECKRMAMKRRIY